MPKKVKCCVPGCGNNYKNRGTLHFYRIPKDLDIRNAYRLLLRNKCVRLDSENTRICSAHFESGLKLSRCHLPNIFPWKTEEDEKTGEKRKNLEQIASVLKTKRTKNSSPEEPLRDRVQGYQYHVPWRFSGVPLNHGVVSTFKTIEEHEQGRCPNVSSTDAQQSFVQRDESSQNEKVDTSSTSMHSLQFSPLSTVSLPNNPITETDASGSQNADRRQMSNVSLTLGSLTTTKQQSMSDNNWSIRPVYTYTSPSTITTAVDNHASQSHVTGSKQLLHVDQNIFQSELASSNPGDGPGFTISNVTSLMHLGNNANVPIQNRNSLADNNFNNHVIKLPATSISHYTHFPKPNQELHQSVTSYPCCSPNTGQTNSRIACTKIYKDGATQTEVCEEDFQQMAQRMNSMRSENRNLKEEVEMLKKRVLGLGNISQNRRFDITKLDHNKLTFYTGFESLEALTTFLSIVKEGTTFLPVWGKVLKEKLSSLDSETTNDLSILDELSLFFVKVKLNLHDTDVAHRFMVTESKVQSVIYTWLQIFYAFSAGSPVYQQLPDSIKEGLKNYGVGESRDSVVI